MSERWTIDELMDLTAAALETADYEGQSSSRVRETPDKRTIRYYTTLGLLDRPAEFRGRTAYYGRRHVLQLAAIKRLQARGMTLVQIQESLAGADDRRLARWAGVPGGFWEQHRPAPPAPPEPDRLLAEQPAPEPNYEAQAVQSPPAPRSAAFWREAPAFGPPPAIPETRDRQEETPAAPQPVAALRLAAGVTLLLENTSAEQIDERVLAELAPGAEALLAQLRRLNLIS